MTGPRVDPAPPLSRVLSPEEFEQAQSLSGPSLKTAFGGTTASEPRGLGRVLSPEEFDQAQSLSGPAIKTMRLPAVPAAPRDVTQTRRTSDHTSGIPLAPFDISDPTTYLNPVLRQVVNPALDNPLTTVGTTLALATPGVGTVVGLAMAGSMVHNIASYGWQRLAEHQLSPEDRKRAEADPERVSGEAAAVQAAMLGLAPLIHVAVKGYRSLDVSPGMVEAGVKGVQETLADGSLAPERTGPPRARSLPETLNQREQRKALEAQQNAAHAARLEEGAATTRIPAASEPPAGFQPTAAGASLKTNPRAPAGLVVPETVTPGKVTPLATDPASAPLEARAALDASVRDYQAERATQDEADLSAARTAAAEKIAKADAMRPSRRPKNLFETEQGAQILGAQAARHGMPETASPYHPDLPLDAAWKAGHEAAAQSYPEGFSMGGALTDNRIPGADELPTTARGGDAAHVPEGATPETVALAKALTPSPFRGHTTDELATAALDAQAELERAQQAVVASQTADHVRWNDPEAAPEEIFYEDRGREASDTPAAMHERALARAKAKLAQIEREFAMRGVSGEALAEAIQGAKEQRLEREGMQSDETLAMHTGEDPGAAPGAPAAPSSGLTPVEGTGELKSRGLSAGVEQKAVANKLVTALGELPEYRSINMAEQARGAAELLAADPALARRVALGQAPAPAHLLPEAVFTAVENRAIAEGDVATIRELATGTLTSEATTMGQRIRALGERDPESPVAAIQRVVDARTGGATNIPAATEETVAAIRRQLSAHEVTADAWATFIDDLRC